MSGNNYADMDWLDRRYRENKALMRAAAQAEMDEIFKRESMVQQAAIGNRAERRKHAAINRKADGKGVIYMTKRLEHDMSAGDRTVLEIEITKEMLDAGADAMELIDSLWVSNLPYWEASRIAEQILRCALAVSPPTHPL